jgi:hypothetical protein
MVTRQKLAHSYTKYIYEIRDTAWSWAHVRPLSAAPEMFNLILSSDVPHEPGTTTQDASGRATNMAYSTICVNAH